VNHRSSSLDLTKELWASDKSSDTIVFASSLKTEIVIIIKPFFIIYSFLVWSPPANKTYILKFHTTFGLFLFHQFNSLRFLTANLLLLCQTFTKLIRWNRLNENFAIMNRRKRIFLLKTNIKEEKTTKNMFLWSFFLFLFVTLFPLSFRGDPKAYIQFKRSFSF
jgi:hypothetical protein